MAILVPSLLLAWVMAQSNPNPPGLSHADLDRLVIDTLKDIHNRGADYYNQQRPEECLAMYEGALRIVRPLMMHRPAIQKIIDNGFAEVAKTTGVKLQAFRLHEVIEDVRSNLKAEIPKKAEPAQPAQPGPTPHKLDVPQKLDKSMIKTDPANVGLVSGMVTLDGKPLGGVSVTAVSINLPEPRVSMTDSRADGTYEFPVVLPPGDYVVKVLGDKVPARFHELATSGLRFSVLGRGQSTIDLKLVGQ